MGATLSDRRAQRQDNTGDLPLIGETPRRQPIVNSDEGGLWILPLVQRAVERSVGHKAAALDAGMDKGQWSRQLAGDGHLSIRRLGLLPQEFWLELIDELRAHFKLDNDRERLERAFDGVFSALKTIQDISRKVAER
jgi:hypothetical protein